MPRVVRLAERKESRMTPAHQAVEDANLPRLRELLDSGVPVDEVDAGLTLLQPAIDVEIDAHTQTGSPLHVDLTAYLIARGADPHTSADGRAVGAARHMAELRGHWLAVVVIDAWGIRPA